MQSMQLQNTWIRCIHADRDSLLPVGLSFFFRTSIPVIEKNALFERLGVKGNTY